MACKTSGNCTVDYTGGKLNPSAGYLKVDTDCDGVINVVPDTYSPTLADQAKCQKVAAKAAVIATAVRKAKVKKAAAPAPAAPLPGQATPTAPAPKAPAKGARGAAVDYSAPIAQAQADATKALQTATEASAKVGTFDAALKDHGDRLTAFDTALAQQKEALAAETARATAAEEGLDNKAQGALDLSAEAKASADTAKAAVEVLKGQGGFIEGYAGGGFIAQRDFDVTPKGATKAVVVRDQFAPTAEVGANIGFETASNRYNLFGAFSPSWDAGDSSMGGTGGAEVTWRLGGSQSYLGLHGLYQRHNAGGNVVYTNAVGNAFGGGLTFVHRGADQKHIGIQARLTAAWETFGTDAYRKEIQDGPVLRLMVDVLGGFSLAAN